MAGPGPDRERVLVRTRSTWVATPKRSVPGSIGGGLRPCNPAPDSRNVRAPTMQSGCTDPNCLPPA
jgi:hypothetical protein